MFFAVINKRSISVLLIAILVIFNISISIGNEEISLWIMAKEYIKHNFSEKEIKEFIRKYPNVNIDIGADKDRSLKVLIENKDIIEDIEKFRKEFIKNNPNAKNLKIKITLIGWHNDPFNKILNKAQKEGIDIVQIGSTWTAFFVKKGIIKDITDILKPMENEFIKSIIQSCRVNKRYYAIPWSLDIRTWFYNKKLLDKAGIKAENIKKLKDFEEACKKFKKRLNNKYFLGIPVSKKDYSTLHTAMAWIWGWGGDIIDENKRIQIFDKNVINGMSHYVKLAFECTPLNHLTLDHLTLVNIEKDFIKGKYAFIFIGPWIIDAINNSDDSKNFINLGSIPGEDITPNTFIGGSLLAIIKSNRSPLEDKASTELLKYLSKKGNYGAGFPSRIEKIRQIFYKNENDQLRMFADTLLKMESRTYPSIPEWGKIENIMVYHIANIFDKIDKNSSVEEIEKIIKEELKKVDKELKKIIELPNSYLKFIIMGIILFLLLIIYLLIIKNQNRNDMVDMVDAIIRFRRAKEILHNSKVYKNKLNDKNIKAVQKDLRNNVEKVISIFESLENENIDLFENIINENNIITLKKYLNKILELDYNNSNKSIKAYEEDLIKIFEENIRSILNKMSDILDECYINSKKLNEIIKELQKMYNNLKYYRSKEDFILMITSDDLKTCLRNLLDNAYNAVNKNNKKNVKLIIQIDKDKVEISIEDNGKGISSEKAELINSGRYKGGQGLRDVKNIMSRWNGSFNITPNNVGAKQILTIRRIK